MYYYCSCLKYLWSCPMKYDLTFIIVFQISSGSAPMFVASK